jgi:hypothetical protein
MMRNRSSVADQTGRHRGADLCACENPVPRNARHPDRRIRARPSRCPSRHTTLARPPWPRQEPPNWRWSAAGPGAPVPVISHLAASPTDLTERGADTQRRGSTRAPERSFSASDRRPLGRQIRRSGAPVGLEPASFCFGVLCGRRPERTDTEPIPARLLEQAFDRRIGSRRSTEPALEDPSTQPCAASLSAAASELIAVGPHHDLESWTNC